MSKPVFNAVIESASIRIERGFMLDSWLFLKYQEGTQGFGGYCLAHTEKPEGPNYAGRWIARCMEIANVEDWAKLPGRTIRIRKSDSGFNSTIEAIGHILENKWFDPRAEFEMLKRHES